MMMDRPSAPSGYRFLVQAFVATEQEAIDYARRTFTVAKQRQLTCRSGTWTGDYETRVWTFNPQRGWTVFVRAS